MRAKTVVTILTFLAFVVFWSITSYAGQLFGDVVRVDGEKTKYKAKLVLSPGSTLQMSGDILGGFTPTFGEVEEVWIDEEQLTLTQKEIVNGKLHTVEFGFIQIRFPFVDVNKFIMIMTPEQLKKLEGDTGFIVDATGDTMIFIISYESGISHSHQGLLKLRDAILDSSPIEKGKEMFVEPGRYVVAFKTKVSRQSNLLSEVGASAPENMLIPSSKNGKYMVRIGQGIVEGALFKRIEDLMPKYNYLKIPGAKEILLRFVEGESTVEFWLIVDVLLKEGELWQQNIRMLQ